MNYKERAIENQKNGYNCCQSVFLPFAEDYGLDRDTAEKIASGFGAGMCMGEMCGAVTGAIMALGLIKGTNEGHGEIFELVKQYTKEFKEKHGSYLCRDLLGCNISIEENYNKVVEAGDFDRVCRQLIGNSAEMIQKYMK